MRLRRLKPDPKRLRVAGLAILSIGLVFLILSTVFPFPEGTWDFLSIGMSQKAMANPDWLSGYDYRKSFNITGSTAGAQTNYPMRLTVHAGNGTDSGSNVYLGTNATTYNVSVASSIHSDYGLGYPVTYIFNIPSGSSNLTGYHRHSTGDSWAAFTEKTSSDFFNGIECVRFNYTTSKAYVSVAFSNATDTTYIQIRNSVGTPIGMSYDSIPEYYDDRTCAVTITADDWHAGSDSYFVTACNEMQERDLWFTPGIITNPPETVNWTSIQAQLDEGYVEAASHSRTHPAIPYSDYDSEIGGSKDDITGNLTLPSLYTSGSSEYVWAWLEPYGDSDATVRSKLGTYKYLTDRDITTDHTWATWDSSNGLYNRIGYSIRIGSDGETNLSTLNANFDARYSAGGIYHLMMHPGNVNWAEGQYAQLHLDYIDAKKDVWYVGFGAMYMYHYVDAQSLATVTAGETRCQNDFDDIRFTQSNGYTELDFWKESYTSTVSADFWVEFNSIPASPDSATFYLYYGNSSATYPTYGNTTLQGQATFILFDDFERGDNLDEVGGFWTEGGTIEISTGQHYSGSGSRSMKLVGAASQPYGYTTKAIGSDFAIRYRLYKENAAAQRLLYCDTDRQVWAQANTDEVIRYYDTDYHTVGTATADTWELYEFNDFDFSSGYNYDIWHEGSEIKADAGMRTTAGTSGLLILYGINIATADSWVDDFIVRKWCDPEPTWGAWGTEQGTTPDISNTPSSNDFGILEVNGTGNTAINYFTITNTGNCAVDVVIYGTDATGGDDTWTLSDTATPGENIYGLYAGLDDEDDTFDVIVRKTETYNTLVSDLAEDATQDWGLKIWMPTSLSGYDAQQMTATITLVASEST